MNTFEKLFVNSTNRISAVKNIILSQPLNNFASTQSSQHSHHNQSKIISKSCNQQQIHQTYEQLQQRYQQLSKIVKQANKQKQIITTLFDKIFLIQQGHNQNMKKRFRRRKNQIQAKYECKAYNCKKIYSSSTSLARHAKLKHSYSCSQPPQHNYQIPPQPNLGDSSQIQKREQTLSNNKSMIGNDEDESDANNGRFDQQPYEGDSQNSNSSEIQVDPSQLASQLHT